MQTEGGENVEILRVQYRYSIFEGRDVFNSAVEADKYGVMFF